MIRPSVKHQLAYALPLLMLGAFLRLYALGEAPRGLQHDEVFKVSEGQAIVQTGDWRLFYPSNQGHEGGYVWLNALSFALFGFSLWTVKFPAFACGMVTLALLYRVGRGQFGGRVALMALALGAVSFWAVWTNRVGLRANLLPVVVLALAWGLVRLQKTPRGRLFWTVFSGLALGFALYTYTAAFAVWGGVGAGLLALGLGGHLRWRAWALVIVLGGGLSLPMLHLRLTTPQGQDRLSTINAPLEALQQGDPRPVLSNLGRLALAPILTGDPEARYNVVNRPLFLPYVGVFVYVGLAVLLGRVRRQPLLAYWGGVLLLGLLPSAFTISAPSFLRSIALLPLVFFALALGLETILLRRRGGAWLALALITLTGLADARAYFTIWANDPALQGIYRADLRALALEPEPPAFVSTADPALLDSTIYAFSGARDPRAVLWFDGRISLPLQAGLLYISPTAPLPPALAVWLGAERGGAALPPLRDTQGQTLFEVYRLGGGTPVQEALAEAARHPLAYGDLERPSALSAPVNFGGALALLGVDLPRTNIPAQDNGVDNGLNLWLYFQPLREDYPEALSIFVHLIDGVGTVWVGRDMLGLPTSTWRKDTPFVQDHYLGSYHILPAQYWLTLGVYEPRTGRRLPILDSQNRPLGDKIILGQISAYPARPE